MECGCTIVKFIRQEEIVYCPLHAAAERMLEALKDCRGLFSDIRNDWADPRDYCQFACHVIDAAIDAATASTQEK